MEGRIGVDKVFVERWLDKCGPVPAVGGPFSAPTAGWWTGPRNRGKNRYPPITPSKPVPSGRSSGGEGAMGAAGAERKGERCE